MASGPRAVPSQDRAKDAVRALLEATEKVSRRVGFEAATTKEIAQVAGVSAGTLYRYFPSKEALLAALVKDQWEVGLREFGEELGELKAGTIGDTIDAAVRLVFRMIARRLEAFGKMRIETNNILHLGAEHVDVAAQFLRTALERRQGDLVVEDLEVASVLVVRTVVFLGRIGVRDYAELVATGRYEAELCAMVRRYLVGGG